ncbi:nicotinate-nucleotide diphosphorylase (carboxylating) [Clostridia bacterium]|nr:nicotinate-nucleotide diphosphorylase (carboxylating) [Clostridia bacterium]
MERSVVDNIIMMSLAEDIGHGDVTTESCVAENVLIEGTFIAKESGVICGINVAARVFALVGGNITFKPLIKDGETVNIGAKIADIYGEGKSILKAERTALNLLQRMSGIATRTRLAVDCVAGYKAKIADTRKTTPGLRVLEKYAVRVGDGTNHRFNLSDGVLIKDNHIAAAGGIAKAVSAARKAIPHTLKIEVEASNLDEVRQALDSGADIIMLDNMSLADMSAAVELVKGKALTEASGNMGDRNLAEVAATGVDIISVGALTHSVRALDISLKFKNLFS